jgi:hypothetical protein
MLSSLIMLFVLNISSMYAINDWCGEHADYTEYADLTTLSILIMLFAQYVE